MKPAAFDYHAPVSLTEAVELLAHLDGAQILAGGQSLVPLMNRRAARPSHLIDLRRISGLDDVTVGDHLTIGAMVSHRTVERSPDVHEANGLLPLSAGFIANTAIRTRGTVGGSLALADPSGEWPLMACLFDAAIATVTATGDRHRAASMYFAAARGARLDADEVVTSVDFPTLRQGEGWAMDEVARRHGDVAIVSAAATVRLEPDGSIADLRLAVGGMAPTPVTVPVDAAVGQAATPDTWAAVAATVGHHVSPASDLRATREDRLTIAPRLVARTLESAARAATPAAS